METKDELIMNVKEWIKIDSEITKLQNELRDRKNKKKQLSELLMIVMKKNEIECFDINTDLVKKVILKWEIISDCSCF